MESRTPQEVLKLAQDSGTEFVDLRFCDLPGVMQHFSVPLHQLTEETFTEGFGFDGSSIRGFQEIQESDMLLMPDPSSVFRDPFFEDDGEVIERRGPVLDGCSSPRVMSRTLLKIIGNSGSRLNISTRQSLRCQRNRVCFEERDEERSSPGSL